MICHRPNRCLAHFQEQRHFSFFSPFSHQGLLSTSFEGAWPPLNAAMIFIRTLLGCSADEHKTERVQVSSGLPPSPQGPEVLRWSWVYFSWLRIMSNPDQEDGLKEMKLLVTIFTSLLLQCASTPLPWSHRSRVYFPRPTDTGLDYLVCRCNGMVAHAMPARASSVLKWTQGTSELTRRHAAWSHIQTEKPPHLTHTPIRNNKWFSQATELWGSLLHSTLWQQLTDMPDVANDITLS